MTPYQPDVVENISHSLDLRTPNAAALDAIAQALDEAPSGTALVADLATGVGKTYIAGALIDYLAASGVRNIAIITPGKTIQRKTIANLTPGHPKYLRGMQTTPTVITIDDLDSGRAAAALEDSESTKVFVLTVQSLLRPNTTEGRRAHRPHESLGQGLYEYLQEQEDLVVIADEHHIYYSGQARRFEAAIDELHPAVLIGLTATPHPDTEELIIYRYPLAAAIADGYVKIPILVGREDNRSDTRTQMADAVALLNVKQAAMREFCGHTRRPFVQPLLFVVTSSIEEANDIALILASPDCLGSPDAVLTVTSDEPDETLNILDSLDEPHSSIRAVVSVSMLKEGWDNKAIYVIAATRALESQLLTEQILGRGLRLPYGHRLGVPMLDSVEVVSHHSFRHLLKEAKSYLEQALGDREVSAVPATTPGVAADPVAWGELAQNPPAQVAVQLPVGAQDLGGTHSDSTEDHVAFGFSAVGARISEGEATVATLAQPLKPRSPNGVRIPLFLPRVTTRWVRSPFTLDQVTDIEAESLGRAFAEDNAPSLSRKMLDASRGESGEVRVRIRDAPDEVAATEQQRLPFDSIETDVVQRLMRNPGIEASMAEQNAAIRIARAFLQGAEVTEATPWRAEHGRLATARLVEWVNSKRVATPARLVKEVTQVRWPEVDRLEMRPPTERHLVSNSREFVKNYPYSGWEKSVFSVVAFDAYGTEFRLAETFERDNVIRAWVRINETVPLRIPYLAGAVQREYEPDFLVIDSDDVHWIVEGKADDHMADPIVVIKRDAAKEWIQAVNLSDDVHQRWGYLLASETVIRNAATWEALKAGAQAFL